MKNYVTWFEIPTVSINRAQEFYETVFDVELTDMDNPSMKMRAFPFEDLNVAAGALVQSDFHKVSDEKGVLIYMDASPSIDDHITRIEHLGGKILVPKTKINDDYGYMAVFRDTEGNRIALHSPS